jgi:Holliday junction resolvase RusA-like endonuclease
MRAICITIPGEPTPKGRPRFGKTFSGQAIAYTPAKTRAGEAVVAMQAKAIMVGRSPFAEPIRVHVLAVLGVPASWSRKRKAVALEGGELPAKKPDLDNLLKLATDALNGIVWTDDALIVEVSAAKVYGVQPRTVVSVEPIGRAQ